MILFFLGSLTAISACQGIDGTGAGNISITPRPITFALTPPGQESRVAMTLSNTSGDPLTIYEMKVEGKTESDSAAGISLEGVKSGEFKVKPGENLTFSVVYRPTLTTPEPNAHLVVRSSDPRYPNSDPLKVDIYTIETAAEIEVTPDPIRFSQVSPGSSMTRRLQIRNRGTRDLVLTEIPETRGNGEDKDYKVGGTNLGGYTDSEKKFPVTLKPYDPDAARQHPEQYQLDVDVVYSPTGHVGENKNAELLIPYKTAGRSKVEQKRVQIRFSTSGPLIFIYPLTRDFGQVPLGKSGENAFVINNNGNEPLVIDKITLSKNSPTNEFSLDSVTLPITVPPGDESQPIFLRYRPDEEGIDTGQVIVQSNDSFQPLLPLELVARGADGACPEVSVGAYVEGVSTTPQPSITAKPLDYIVLDGSRSSDSDGEIRRWEWQVVKKPLGASSSLEALASDTTNSDFSRRRYRPLVAGDYEISLNVYDNEGFSGCSPQVVRIKVTPAKKIHIELTWTNPADPDETDSVGSDVDLHMVKMGGDSLVNGPGRWFVPPYDIYFENKSVFWDPEKPTLDLDDRDGAGPENIQLDNPVNCGWYAVGVDYFKQIYGTAYVTVRIYINQQLVSEYLNLPLTKQESFYDIARIHWDGSQGTVYDVSQYLPTRPRNEKPAQISEMSSLCRAVPL